MKRGDEMAAVRTDIVAVNSALLQTIASPLHTAWVRRRWAVHETILGWILKATTREIRCVARCGTPLFQLSVPEMVEPGESVPTDVAQVQLRALLTALRAARADETAAVTLFRTAPEALERLLLAPLETIQAWAHTGPTVIRVYGADSPPYWRNLLMGGRIGGKKGARLVQQMALMGTE